MAVNGTSSATSSLLSSGRMNISGLASGMNTDEIIEGMTVGTRSKIAKVKQQQTLLGWQTDAFRGIADKLISLSTKYTSYMSPATNLMSTRLFSKTVVAAQGANASKVSITGAGHDNMSIAGVKQMAKNASVTTGERSSRAITTDALGDLTENRETSKLEGGTLKIKYGSTDFTLKLEAGTDLSSGAAIESALNDQLAKMNFGSNSNLGDMLEFKFTQTGDARTGAFALEIKDSDNTGNGVQITGGSSNVLVGLGFLNESTDGKTAEEAKEIIENSPMGKPAGKGEPITGAITGSSIMDTTTGAAMLAGKSMTFMMDGVRKTINFHNDADQNQDINSIRTHLQTQLDKEYGAGRITVGTDNDKLTFATAENTSVLRISEASTGVSGNKGVLGNIVGRNNRINLNAKIGEAGFGGLNLDSIAKDGWLTNEKGEYLDQYGKVLENQADEAGRVETYKLEINGKSIKGITANTTVKQLMDKINSSDAGVNISYMEMSDRFSITSKVDGAAGKVEYDGADNLATQLFGDLSSASKTDGQDAILSIKYKGTNETHEIRRASNNVDLDGMTVTLKGEFGYDAGGNIIAGTEDITFTASADTDKLVEAVKAFIKDYNEMLDAVNEQVSTKPARDAQNRKSYQPLTDEQRDNMSDKEIERWETEAKKGILFNDMSLRNIMSDFRFMVGSEGASMGIKPSSRYTDYGKLEFDEEAFRKAVAEDPQKVQDFFTKEASTNEKGGLMQRVKTTLDKYSKTEGATKGLLINKAGHPNSPLSVLNNSMKNQLDILDKNLVRLQSTLKAQTDRYYKQFTSLETFIQRMNVQSGYLMQQSGVQ